MVQVEFMVGLTLNRWNHMAQEAQTEIIKSLVDVDRADCLDVANNVQVFNRFIMEAHKVVDRGRTHYSARTIGEVIRHETALQDDKKSFKINNNLFPKLARVSMSIFPALNGLFELRG